MQCVNCGFENIPGMQQCVRCQSSLDLAEAVVAPPRAGRYRAGTRLRQGWNGLRLRLKDLTQALPRWRPRSGPLDHVAWEALVQSAVLPGLGLICRGRRLAGWLLLGAWLGCITSAVALYGSQAGAWLLMGAVAAHGMAILAHLGPGLAELTTLGRMWRGGMVFAVLALAVYLPPQILLGRFYVPLQVPAGMPANPVLRAHETVFREGPWRRPERYARGDLVFYRIHAQQHGGVYVRQGHGLDRVVGLPGDQVTVTGGEVLVNGMPPARGLLGAVSGLPDLSYTVGPDEYFILPTMAGLQQLHGPLADQQVTPVLLRVSRVRSDDVLGRVVFRTFPWSRWGPVR